MESPDGRYAITFNGEIYNFLELRRELNQQGFQFRSDSDTEVILAAYQHWGRNCQLRFNGMWAFAIYDRQLKTLFLSRDRFGVKPLHYLFQPGRLFAFASETLAFKHLQDYTRSLDSRAFLRSLSDFSSLEAYGYTIYRDIFQLLPGHCAEMSRDGQFRQLRWWDTLAHTTSPPADYQQQVEHFRELFQSACRLRLRSDVPVASALSGGVDSSAVYCTLHHLMSGQAETVERLPKNWQTAFVATFPNTKVDERKYAEEVVAHVQGQAHYLSPDYSRLVPDIESTTRLFDGISGTPLICLTDVYKGMRQNRIVVSLDGHGVDELLFGYRSSVHAAYQAAHQAGEPEADEYRQIYLEMMFEDERQKALLRLEQQGPIARAGGLRQSLRAAKGALKRLFLEPTLPEVRANPWVSAEASAKLPFLTPDFHPIMTRAVDDPINYRNFHYAELPYNLRDFDRGSMQHGIEIRMPFMDYRLVTYLFSLRAQSKLGGGYTKRILRDAMKGIMPEAIRTRRLKIGLGSPLREWFNGSMSQYLLDEVRSQGFRENPYIKADPLRKFVEERTRNQSWSDEECSSFWPILNGHILLKS